ncbi:MAG TPA: hypothetical protein VN241_12420 [Microbacterium sp.]|nr:hypothetical protein [Microbacterium sp.]
MSRIDWRIPRGRRDHLFGTGATPVEKLLAIGVAAVGTALVLAAAPIEEWFWWQTAIVSVVAFDLLGGVVANGLGSAKREHHHDGSDLRPMLFAAAHVQPIVVGLMFGALWWGFAWYAVALVSVVVVRSVPLFLQRPVALGACTIVAVVAPAAPSPDGLGWVPVVLMLKLALAHAVTEEPYRPKEAS